MAGPIDKDFSLVIGGPFYRAQQRLGLLAPDCLPNHFAAPAFVLIAWFPPALLSVMQGVAVNADLVMGGFFLDYGVYARFILAIASLVIMERHAEQRFRLIIDQFLTTTLLTANVRPDFLKILKETDRRTSSTLAESVILVLAFILSFNTASIYFLQRGLTWFTPFPEGDIALSWAGWWTLFISLPLFWLLFLRWFWRLLLWTLMLHSISRLKLNLVATHPDQCGGIGFLALFPVTFSVMIFALSCLMASVILSEVLHGGWSLEKVGVAYLGWQFLVYALFIGPLSVFTPVLQRLKVSGLLAHGALYSRLSFDPVTECKSSDTPDEYLPEPLPSTSVGELAAEYEVIQSIKTVPVRFQTFKNLFFASALPWLVIVLAQVPFWELLTIVGRALL